MSLETFSMALYSTSMKPITFSGMIDGKARAAKCLK